MKHIYLNKLNYKKVGFSLKLLFSMFPIMVLLASCEDIIEVKLNDENMNLAGVEASISTLDEPKVFLYKTLQVDKDTDYPGISGALVTITDNLSNTITLTEDSKKAGLYTVPQNKSFKGVAGREYKLEIKNKGITLTATEKLERVEPIDSIQVFPSMRGNKLFLGVFSYGKEPKGVGNYYKWDVYVNDTLIIDASRMAIASDEFVDGNYISKLEIYTDFHDPDKPEKRVIKLNDEVKVRQNSISDFVYKYYFQIINQSTTGGLFSVPPANIKSNIISSDGRPVLGLFSASDVSISNKVEITPEIESQLRKR